MTVMIALVLFDDAIGQRFRDVRWEMITLLCAATGIFVIGLIDDVKGLGARLKLVSEMVAAGALCAADVQIDTIGIGGGQAIRLGWLACPVTALWVVGVTNAVNLCDGLDGLAAGVSAIACGVIAIVALYSSTLHTGSSQSNSIMMVLFAMTLLGSLYGFLIFNFNPAKIFMGDCGSLFLGFTIAGASVLCVSKSAVLAGLALPALALGIPIFDVLFSMLRRFLERRSLFAPDRSHFHHRLLNLGMRHRDAVLAIYSATLAITGVGLLMIVYENVFSLVLFLCLLILIALLFRMAGAVRFGEVLGRLREKHAISEVQRRERVVLEHLQLKVRQLQDASQAWDTMCEAALHMDCAWISLKTLGVNGWTELESWHRPTIPSESSQIVVVVLPVGDRNVCPCRQLEIAVCTNGSLESASRKAALFGRLIDEGMAFLVPEDGKVQAEGGGTSGAVAS
jgi:UDP-GlcNAc:undecaprenyl-phosphate GlcNAc-1-phosphate transferase